MTENLSMITRTDVEKAIGRALKQLEERDTYLLTHNLNERTIVHKFAIYLQEGFAEWDVDVEFNRDRHDPKVLSVPTGTSSTDDTDAHTVYPDIIVHKRGSPKNLLVIEVKKSTNTTGDRAFDAQKLTAFKEQLQYEHAYSLEIVTGPKWHMGVTHTLTAL